METLKITTYENAQDYIDEIVDYLRYELEVERTIPCKIESALYSISLYGGRGGIEFSGGAKRFFKEFANEYFAENK